MNNLIKKIVKKRIPGIVSALILIFIFIFCSYQIGVKASGNVIFAGEVVYIMPVAGCQYSNLACSATCPICQCGPWSEVYIAPIGSNSVSSFFMCPVPSMIPFGAPLHIGGIVFGYADKNWVFLNNGSSVNIWSL